MNVILKKQLPRRTFLRGMGSVVALPMLDAMMPLLFATIAPESSPGLRASACLISAISGV